MLYIFFCFSLYSILCCFLCYIYTRTFFVIASTLLIQRVSK